MNFQYSNKDERRFNFFEFKRLNFYAYKEAIMEVGKSIDRDGSRTTPLWGQLTTG